MERLLGELLEHLDKRYPENTTIEQLLHEGFEEKLIFEAISAGLIGISQGSGYEDKRINVFLDAARRDHTQFVVMHSNGFMMLNQIRLKKATDDLNKSIRKFDTSSRITSIVMIVLTAIIALLTIFLIITG